VGLELRVCNLDFAYGAVPVLHDITLPAMRSGQVSAVLGPNGGGKSTLLRCIAGVQQGGGTVVLSDGENPVPEPMTARRRFRRPPTPPATDEDRIIYVPQDLPPASSITVFEAVLLACQRNATPRPARATINRVGDTLEQLGIAQLAGRSLAELSGGQRQLVSIAQAVARRPDVLLLDEPTSNLDLRNQLEILGLVRAIATSRPAVVVLTIHDLSLASRFADQVAILHRGTLHSGGPPASVITEAMLREVYEVEATVHRAGDGALTMAATRGL
jgi:iron complex transport system ATP-binding protein